MTYAGPQHYHVKVRVYNESIDFGKGVAELLQRIEATGSLSAAYKAMDMSASKAWKILRRAEADLGFALVSSTAGGKSGGGSSQSRRGIRQTEDFRNEVTNKEGSNAEDEN